MKQELGKYYLRYAWFPRRLNNGKLIWFSKYYEARMDTPLIEPVYTISRLSEEDYLVDTLMGVIVDGVDHLGTSFDRERMLNANHNLL